MVTYFVCFDSSKSIQDQLKHISFWLDFLNSSLPLPPPPSPPGSKWSIIIVGLKSDLQQPSSSQLTSQHLSSWKLKWPRLPILNQLFSVSSLTSKSSVQHLLSSVEKECNRIFSLHSTQIPTSYRRVLQLLQSRPDEQVLVHTDTLHQECAPSMDPQSFKCMIRYFHAIGRIVLIEKNGLVFTNPTLAPKIAAKFISPEEVRIHLLKGEDENVQLLTEEDIGCLINISVGDNQRCVTCSYLILFIFLISFFSDCHQNSNWWNTCKFASNSTLQPLKSLFISFPVSTAKLVCSNMKQRQLNSHINAQLPTLTCIRWIQVFDWQ